MQIDKKKNRVTGQLEYTSIGKIMKPVNGV